MSERGSVAMMRLALDALEDPKCPLLLKLAAQRYVYYGERETFHAMLMEAAGKLGLTAT